MKQSDFPFVFKASTLKENGSYHIPYLQVYFGVIIIEVLDAPDVER